MNVMMAFGIFTKKIKFCSHKMLTRGSNFGFTKYFFIVITLVRNLEFQDSSICGEQKRIDSSQYKYSISGMQLVHTSFITISCMTCLKLRLFVLTSKRQGRRAVHQLQCWRRGLTNININFPPWIQNVSANL